MANHALPTTTSLYTDVLTNLKDRIDDSLKMLDSVNTSPTNIPTNAIRWNSTTTLWEKYSGSAWGSLAASYAIQVLKSSNLVGGNSTTLLGSIPYQSNTNITSLLSPNTTTTRKFLRQTGTGTNGAVPVWDTILASDVPTLNQSTTGNAATATKLAIARTIGGVSFNGTANIDLPGVNTTGNQNTTGNATTATTANALNSSNSYTGVGFTANTGAFRVQNWGGVPTNGVTYYGNANSYIYKGAYWEFRNEQSGFTNFLNTSGAIVTQDGGTWSINATSSSALVGDETNWATYRSRSVANMLGWKNYSNGHCIFDASAGTAPNGAAVNNTNPNISWYPTHPTLMGWDGSQTFGVRVDSARVADNGLTALSMAGNGYLKLGGGLIIQWGTYSGSLTHGTSYTATFPIAFPNACLKVIGQYGNTPVSTVVGAGFQKITQMLTNSFTFQWGWQSGGTAQVDVNYVAIGY